MDQIHLPDPVELEICELKKQVEDLKKVVETLKDDK